MKTLIFRSQHTFTLLDYCLEARDRHCLEDILFILSHLVPPLPNTESKTVLLKQSAFSKIFYQDLFLDLYKRMRAFFEKSLDEENIVDSGVAEILKNYVFIFNDFLRHGGVDGNFLKVKHYVIFGIR